jgi:YHS domain-containing protein
VYRVGDYVGNTVNLASRVTTEAMPNEILITEPVARAASQSGIDTSPVGVRALRGSSEPLSLHRVRAVRAPVARDPVCGKAVGEDAAARLVRDGQVVLFDSEECLRAYLAEPVRYPVG